MIILISMLCDGHFSRHGEKLCLAFIFIYTANNNGEIFFTSTGVKMLNEKVLFLPWFASVQIHACCMYTDALNHLYWTQWDFKVPNFWLFTREIYFRGSERATVKLVMVKHNNTCVLKCVCGVESYELWNTKGMLLLGESVFFKEFF